MSKTDFYIGLDMDVKQAVAWLDRIKRGLDDARPMWKVMLPKIKTFADQEFTGRNPNKWRELMPTYRQWKLKKGYPQTIGIRKGKLKSGAVDIPIVKMNKKEMNYAVNQSNVKEDGKFYAHWFDRKRKVFKWTIFKINTVIEGITLKHIDKQLRDAK